MVGIYVVTLFTQVGEECTCTWQVATLRPIIAGNVRMWRRISKEANPFSSQHSSIVTVLAARNCHFGLRVTYVVLVIGWAMDY